MKAVILAAGIGSRLWPLTKDKPKCLVKVAGKSILDYQLEAYKSAGIKEVIIVIGYAGDAIVEHCKHIKGINIRYVHNKQFENTNNMYSLYLARDLIGNKPFFLSNADVALDREIITGLAADQRADLIGVDAGKYNDESMKVTIGDDGVVTDISKSIVLDSAHGVSIDVYKFSASASKVLFGEVSRIVADEGNLNDWTEVALQRLYQSEALSSEPFDIAPHSWVEIDDHDDLARADLIFADFDRSLASYSKIFLDLDGTVYVQDQPTPGVLELVHALREQNKRVYFLSNNSSRSKEQYVEKLTNLGLACVHEDVILSTDALIEFLINSHVNKVWVLGTSALCAEIEKSGISITDSAPEYVVVGYDTELTYEKLRISVRLINAGVDILATHIDMVCPTLSGPIPDAGALLEMIYATTGKRPIKTFGKPSVNMIAPYLEQGDQALIIGDRLYTDIELAIALEIDSILVLTGDTSRAELEYSDVLPSACVKNLSALTGGAAD